VIAADPPLDELSAQGVDDLVMLVKNAAGANSRTLSNCLRLLNCLRQRAQIAQIDDVSLANAVDAVLDGILKRSREEALASFADPTTNRKSDEFKQACLVASAGELLNKTDEEALKELARLREVNDADLKPRLEAPRQDFKARRVLALLWSPRGVAGNERTARRYIQAIMRALLREIAGPKAIQDLWALVQPQAEGVTFPRSTLSAGRTRDLAIARRGFLPLTNSPVSFIPRQGYRQQFDELLDNGQKFIAFVGEPGNGKTRLADELVATRVRPGERRVNLRAHDPAFLMNGIAGALAEAKIDTYDKREGELERAFAAYVCSPEAPAYVVVDDATDAEILDRLFPLGTRSVVVITSRGSPLPEGRGAAIHVKEFESPQATDFAHHLLPDASDSDVELLTGTLGNRPLAIQLVARNLLFGSTMTVLEFQTAFDADAAAVMQRAGNVAKENYTWIYAEVFAELERVDQKAAWLLRFIAFLAPEEVPLPLLRAALAVASPPERPELEVVEFQAALRRLHARFLIEISYDGVMAIHSFTQSMLRSLLREQAVEICLYLHDVLRDAFRDAKAEELALRTEGTYLLPHILGIVLGLEEASPDQWLETGLGKTVAMLIRSFRQSSGILYLWRLNSLIDRLIAPEMANVRTHHDWLEVDREWMAVLSDMGQLDLMTYHIALVRSNSLDETTRTPGGKFRELLRLLQAGADTGKRYAALPTVDGLREMDWLPPRFRAEVECLRGEIHTALGNWAEAETSLHAAMAFYAEGDEPDRAGQARAHKGILDVLIFSRPLDWDAFSSWIGQRQELWNSASERSPLLRAYLSHGLARYCAWFISYFHFFRLRRVASSEQSQDGYWYDVFVTEFARNVESAVANYTAYGAPIRAVDLLYEIQILTPFIEPRLRPEFAIVDYIKDMLPEPIIKPDLSLSTLADLKVSILRSEVRPNAVADLQAMAYKFACDQETPYWYCEALIAACGAAVLTHASYRPMLPALAETLESIGRLDRWNELMKALDEYESNHNVGSFLEVFSYFLTY